MALKLSALRYQVEIPPMVWPEFFDLMTDDNRGRLITLKIIDTQMGDFEVLRRRPLFSIAYEPPDHGNDLVVTVSRCLGKREVTYAHQIVYPQTVTIITDEDGMIQSCTVIDDDHAQTIIDFQS